VLLHAAQIGAVALAPLGFFALGVILAGEAEEGQLAFPPALTRPVALVAGLRLVVAPALLFGLSLPLLHLPHVYLLQAAMPTGVNGLLIAHAYGLDLRTSASAVAWTTTVVVVVATIASLV
jgi:predicted permease